MLGDYSEDDSQRVKELSAMIKRYEEDKKFLSQYIESDQVDDNGKLIKAVLEIDDQAPVMRPVIRLTSIDPKAPVMRPVMSLKICPVIGTWHRI